MSTIINAGTTTTTAFGVTGDTSGSLALQGGGVTGLTINANGAYFSSYTTTAKNALTGTAGMVVFDSTLGKLCVYTGVAWQTITSL